MATIEPRLMHLLNDAQSPEVPPKRPCLPFGASPSNASNTNSVSLPPLEPDGGHRGDQSKQIPPFYTIADVTSARPTNSLGSWGESSYQSQKENINVAPGRAGCKAGVPHGLQILLEDTEISLPSGSLRMILDEFPYSDLTSLDDGPSKKRPRVRAGQDDFVQLPQPMKRQKSTQNVVPPIINGLHEPPPDAAMFPPIASGSFDNHEAHALKLSIGNIRGNGATSQNQEVERHCPQPPVVRNKRKAAKPRRKWTEEETNNLLLGVSRHGVGKWTTILEDAQFTFNERTAGDLKDRFRTCCPDELRGPGRRGSGKERGSPVSGSEVQVKARHGLQLESILISPEEGADKDNDKAEPSPSSPDSSTMTKTKKSRAHRKKIEDLVELGIRGPFKKSHRRERRPFTDKDDTAILEGLELYGPAWTKIQRDPRYNLYSRQPTDLRDRVRNKYPDIYTGIEKGSFQAKGTNTTNLLEPSVNTTMENSFMAKTAAVGGVDSHASHINRSGSKEDPFKWSLPLEPETLFYTSYTAELVNEAASSAVASSNVGEMDISRLLLDDSQLNAHHSDPVRLGGCDRLTAPPAAAVSMSFSGVAGLPKPDIRTGIPTHDRRAFGLDSGGPLIGGPVIRNTTAPDVI